MMLEGKFLRKTETGYAHKCPGCNEFHHIQTGNRSPSWTYDGNKEAPSFRPSVRIRWGLNKGDPCCHYFIKKGKIEFCRDSTHELAGIVVDMLEISAEEGRQSCE